MREILQFIIPALCVLAGIVYTQHQVSSASKRQAGIEDKKVDAEAYDRARKFDQEVVEGLRQELRRAKDEIHELRTTLQTERREHLVEIRDLSAHIDKLEAVVDKCIRRLRQLDPNFEEPIV